MKRIRLWLLWFRALAVLFFSFGKEAEQTIKSEAPRVVVFPQISRIGDLVCATPVFRAFKVQYPNGKLVVVMSNKKGAWKLLKGHPRVDEILFYEDKNLVEKLRNWNFNAGINLTTYPVPSVLMALARIPIRAKTIVTHPSKTERLTDWMNTKLFPYTHHTHLPRHYLKLLSVVGIEHPEEVKEVVISGKAEAEAQIFFKGIPARRILVGISLSAGNTVKEWPSERFVELAKRILVKYNDTHIIFIGSQVDEERITQAVHMIADTDRVTTCVGVPIEHLAAYMQKLHLYIAVDTGPIYIAHALGILLIDIVGPCDPNEQPPHDEKSICVLPAGQKPSSFVLKSPESYEQRRKAVLATTVENVFNAVQKQLEYVHKK